MRRRTPPTAIQPDRATRSCQVPRRSRWGTVRWRGFECFVPSSPRAPASSRTSDAPLLLDRRGWLLWAGSRGRGSWPTIAAMTVFFCSHHFTVLPPSPDTVPFLKTRGRATSSLPSINKSQVTSSHFPTTSCQNIWFSRRFHSILVHQELGASLWLVPASTTAQHSSDKGTPPLPVGCLRNLTPPAWRCTGRDAPLLAGICRLAHPSEPLPAATPTVRSSIREETIAAPSQTGRGGAAWPRTASSSACRCVEWLALSSVKGCRSRTRESRMVELRPEGHGKLTGASAPIPSRRHGERKGGKNSNIAGNLPVPFGQLQRRRQTQSVSYCVSARSSLPSKSRCSAVDATGNLPPMCCNLNSDNNVSLLLDAEQQQVILLPLLLWLSGSSTARTRFAPSAVQAVSPVSPWFYFECPMRPDLL